MNFANINVLCCQGIQNRARIIKPLLNYMTCSFFGPYWENIGLVFLCKFMDLACNPVHKLTKKKRPWPTFSYYRSHASSVTYIYDWEVGTFPQQYHSLWPPPPSPLKSTINNVTDQTFPSVSLTNILKNCHRSIWRQDVIRLIHKHLLVVSVRIATAKVLFIELKCLMKKRCGVFKNWQ